MDIPTVTSQYLFAFTKDANLNFWKKCDNAHIAFLDGKKIGFEEWEKLTERERYDLLCACFALIMQGFQAPESGLNERVRNLEKLVHEKCVWKDDK